MKTWPNSFPVAIFKLTRSPSLERRMVEFSTVITIAGWLPQMGVGADEGASDERHPLRTAIAMPTVKLCTID